MSGGGDGGRRSAGTGEDAEVDALLRATEEAVLLKLRTNSHLVSSSADDSTEDPSLDPELARRFDALKLRGQAAKPPASSAGGGGGIDELGARFAALKGLPGASSETNVKLEDLEGEGEEVEKVMRWAMDAARLDAVTAGDEKTKREDAESSVSSEEDDDEKDLEMEKRKQKEKNKSKKWFFF